MLVIGGDRVQKWTVEWLFFFLNLISRSIFPYKLHICRIHSLFDIALSKLLRVAIRLQPKLVLSCRVKLCRSTLSTFFMRLAEEVVWIWFNLRLLQNFRLDVFLDLQWWSTMTGLSINRGHLLDLLKMEFMSGSLLLPMLHFGLLKFVMLLIHLWLHLVS